MKKATLAARGLVLVLGLFALAAVGRYAAARAAVAATTLDAGVAPVLALVPSTPPSAEPPGRATAPPPVATPPSPAPSSSPPSSTRATPEDPVYVNYASAEQLRRLPGVGPKRAEAIVALRGRMGRFQRVEDLLRVKGIGRATIKKWRPLLRLDLPSGERQGDGGAP